MKFKIIKVTKMNGEKVFRVKYKPYWWVPFYITLRLGSHEKSEFYTEKCVNEAMEIVMGWYTKSKEVVKIQSK